MVVKRLRCVVWDGSRVRPPGEVFSFKFSTLLCMTFTSSQNDLSTHNALLSCLLVSTDPSRCWFPSPSRFITYKTKRKRNKHLQLDWLWFPMEVLKIIARQKKQSRQSKRHMLLPHDQRRDLISIQLKYTNKSRSRWANYTPRRRLFKCMENFIPTVITLWKRHGFMTSISRLSVRLSPRLWRQPSLSSITRSYYVCHEQK